MESFDLVIVGAGSGNTIIGPEHDDWSIAMVEEWDFGGTCLNRGCIPTKMFVHTADQAEAVRDLARFGVDAHIDGIRWRDIRNRVFDRIDPIAAGGERYRRHDNPNVTVFGGRGRFVGERRVEVALPEGAVQIEGRQVVIAAGSRPSIPDIPGLAEAGFHTSDDLMRAERVPEHLVVIGGGFIACELAHVFGAFGSAVSIIQRGPRLLRAEDDDIARAVTRDFHRRFDVRCNVNVTAIRRRGAKVELSLDDGTSVMGTDILVATGRTPNSDRIDAPAGGIVLHPDGRVAVDRHQRTSAPGVWALGDISSPHMLKHVANHEARVVRHNLSHPDDLRATVHDAVPHAVFTNPQIAAVGLTEREAAEQGLDYMVSRQEYAGVAYGWALEDTTSFCKLVADRRTRRLLGAHIIGPHAASLIQQLVQGIVFGLTIEQLAHEQYYIHPALSEIVENALLRFPPP